MSHLNLSTHYIDRQFVLHCRTMRVMPLQVMEKHTAEFILSAVLTILDDFKLTKFDRYSVVSDSGSNMIYGNGLRKVFKMLRCVDHRLSTCIKRVFSKAKSHKHQSEIRTYMFCKFSSQVYELIDAAKKLVADFNRSGDNSALKSSLKGYCETRWNGLYCMLLSILDEFETVGNICIMKNKSALLNGIDRTMLEHLVQFLKPFHDAIIKFEAGNKPTLHLVCKEYFKLIDFHLQPDEDDSLTIRSLKEIMLDVVRDKIILDDFHKTASFLDPRQKNKLLIMGLTEADISIIKKKIQEIASKFHGEFNTTTSVSDVTPKKPRYVDIFDMEPTDESTFEEKLRIEMENYNVIRIEAKKDFDILMWWKNHQNIFPIISKVARTLLAIPCCSSKPESDFSVAGYLKSSRRYNLAPDILDDMLVVKSNYDLIESFDYFE